MGAKKSKKNNSNSNGTQIEELTKEATSVGQAGADGASLADVLSEFANFLQQPSLSLLSFEGLVSVSKALKKLPPPVFETDEEQAQAMEAIYNDYWALLLRTRLGIEILIKKCKLQRRNVKMFLEIIQECQSHNSELSKDDQIARQECIEQLDKWFKNGEFDTLIEGWSDIHARLEEPAKNFEIKKSKITVGSILPILSVFGSGASNGALITLDLTEVRDLLSKMTKSLELFQSELNKQNHISQVDNYKCFKDPDSLSEMKSSLEDINQKLDGYISQGQFVIENVDKTCQEMIHC